MGQAESTPQPPAPTRSISRRERRREQAPVTTFDEKFDALRIDHADAKPTERIIFPSENSEHVDAAGTEQYVRQLLKDSKNKLGLSALSSSNPAAVLEKPSSVIKDTQFFNLKIPHEGSPVTNQRSSGRCWIFAACTYTKRQKPSHPLSGTLADLLPFAFRQRFQNRHHAEVQH